MTAATALRDRKAVRSARYSAVAVILHWLIAFGILFQVSLAWRFKDLHTPEGFALTQLHKSVGVTILFLSLIRLAWRLMNPPPPFPADMAPWEKGLAHAVHWALYAIMIGMPLTGWIMVSASRVTIPTLLYGVIPWPNAPGIASLGPVAKHAWHAAGEGGHVWLSYAFYGLFVLHAAGALKHQFVGEDQPVVRRMLPGPGAARVSDWRLLFVALAVVAAVALGKLVTPPNPGMAPPPQRPGDEAAPMAAAAAAPVPAAPIQAPAAAPAAPAATAAPNPDAGPARWALLPGSTLGFATSWSGQPLSGRFDKWKADILFSPEALDRSKVTVAIDVGSVNTGDQQRDAALPSDDWFDAAAHPKAIFTATRFEKTGSDRYVAHGSLELRGVKRPVDLPFTLHISGDKADVSGVTSLDRTVFGVGQGEWQSTDQIPAKVSVNIRLKAKRG